MGISPVPGVFDKSHWGRPLSEQEAYPFLKNAEEHGLVHLTWSVQGGHLYICNCCGCCCHVLRGINELGISEHNVVNSQYGAQIDPDSPKACGVCADERCQVSAIDEAEDGCKVIKSRCIGCGLCVSTCPSEAVRSIKRDEKDRILPPQNEDAWFEEPVRLRGVDFSHLK